MFQVRPLRNYSLMMPLIGESLEYSFKKQLKSSFDQFTLQYITMLLENNIQGLINIATMTVTMMV